MRVISEWGTTDIDYESSIFRIEENEDETGIVHEIIASNNGAEFVMSSDSTIDEAVESLAMLHKSYKHYIIAFPDTSKTITDEIVYELDKPFNNIDIKEFNTLYFSFKEYKENKNKNVQ